MQKRPSCMLNRKQAFLHRRFQRESYHPPLFHFVVQVFIMCVCVHLSVYTNVWMDNHTQIMLPLTIIHRPNFPGLLKPPPSLQWKLVWEKMKDRSDFHAPR